MAKATKKKAANKATDKAKLEKGLPTSTSSSGLKRRSAAPSSRVVAKPNKMKLVKPRRMSNKNTDYANSSLLVFPTDKHGLTANVKSAMKTAATRIHNEDDLLLLGETLTVLMKHVEARYKQHTATPTLKRRSDSIAEAARKAEAAQDDNSGEE